MEKNCINYRLGDSINNDNLQKLGEFVINVTEREITNAAAQQCLVFYPYSPITIAVSEGGGFGSSLEELVNNPKTSLTISGGVTLYFKNADYKISLVSKYNLKSIATESASTPTIFSMNPSKLECSERLLALELRGVAISEITDISFIGNLSLLENLYISGSNVIGNLSSLADMSSFVRCCIYNCQVNGELSNLGKNINCIKAQLNGSQVTGSLESLAEAMISNGRTSGYVNVICNGIITYNGSAVANGTERTITFSNGSYTIS